jgi:hypothetical protein
MSRVEFDAHGPVGGIPAGMVLVCNRCRERWGEGDPDLPTSWEGTPQARCPRCDEDESWVLKGFHFESIHRPQKATARRWGSALRGDDTSHGTFPNVLLLGLPALGLDLQDFALILLFGCAGPPAGRSPSCSRGGGWWPRCAPATRRSATPAGSCRRSRFEMGVSPPMA